jgi:hypothetical protein
MELINARTGLYSDPQLQAKPWDRLAGESHKAFDAFTEYRGLPADRTFQQVADLLHCNGSNVRRWAARWNWCARARDWDIEQDQQYQASQIRERKRMAERIVQGAMLLQEIALQQAEKLLHEVKDGREIRDAKGQFLRVEAVNLTPSEIAKLYEIGTKAERAARGDPNENTVVQFNVFFEMEPLTGDEKPEEINALARAMLPGK